MEAWIKTDITPREKGHWEKNMRGDYCVVCSRCGFGIDMNQYVWQDCNRASDDREGSLEFRYCCHYCPQCGAEMEVDDG